MKAVRVAVAVSTALLLGAIPATADSEVLSKSDNVTHVKQFAYKGGTELGSAGKYLISGELNGETDRSTHPEKGGMHIFDTKTKKELSFLHCPGTDNDVEPIKPGLVAMGFSSNICAPQAGNGFMLIDIKNPRKPRIVGMVNTGKTHTFKPLPGTNYVYTAGGGLSGGNNAGPAVVDVSDPKNPKVVATPKTITMDCHDISFWTEGEQDLGFCAGAIGTGEVQIWDVTDPLAPVTLGRIFNPLIQYSHYAVASTDGQVLAIDDEAFGVHDCNTGQSPTGRVWFYDISNPATPIPQGSMAAPRGGSSEYANIGTFPGWTTSWCLSHGLDWQPGTRNLAVTWFTGGVSVLNASDPMAPTEVAHFQAEDSTTYSTLWHAGHLFTNDMLRGVDMFKIKDLPK